MLMAKIEALKSSFEKQTTHISEDMRTELNAQNVGGDLYKAGGVLKKIKAADESLLVKLQYLPGSNIGEDVQADVNIKGYFVLYDENIEEEDVEELEGHTSGSRPPVDHTTVNHIKGLNISWGNCRGGNILLTASNFSFPFVTFPNMLSMWFCGDI